jgi:hypothetical protein
VLKVGERVAHELLHARVGRRDPIAGDRRRQSRRCASRRAPTRTSAHRR